MNIFKKQKSGLLKKKDSSSNVGLKQIENEESKAPKASEVLRKKQNVIEEAISKSPLIASRTMEISKLKESGYVKVLLDKCLFLKEPIKQQISDNFFILKNPNTVYLGSPIRDDLWKSLVLELLNDPSIEIYDKIELFQLFKEAGCRVFLDKYENGISLLQLLLFTDQPHQDELFLYFITSLPGLLRQKDKDDNSILHYLLLIGHPNGVHYLELLLEKFNPSIDLQFNQKNKDGLTPLHLAVKTRNKAAVKLLLDAKCNINIMDNQNKTAIDYARELNDPEMMKLF